MKKYFIEFIILILQLTLFYIFPLFAGPTDMIGLIFIIIINTFLFALLLGILSTNKIKYVYPIIITILFIPSIFIFYNTSAFIYCLWYLLGSMLAIIIGSFIGLIYKKIKNLN